MQPGSGHPQLEGTVFTFHDNKGVDPLPHKFRRKPNNRGIRHIHAWCNRPRCAVALQSGFRVCGIWNRHHSDRRLFVLRDLSKLFSRITAASQKKPPGHSAREDQRQRNRHHGQGGVTRRGRRCRRWRRSGRHGSRCCRIHRPRARGGSRRRDRRGRRSRKIDFDLGSTLAEFDHCSGHQFATLHALTADQRAIPTVGVDQPTTTTFPNYSGMMPSDSLVPRGIKLHVAPCVGADGHRGGFKGFGFIPIEAGQLGNGDG